MKEPKGGKLVRKAWCLPIGGLLLSLVLWGCGAMGDHATDPTAKPKVVVTSTILADLTEKVGEDAIEVRSLLQPGADPHVYEPVPADSIAFEQADLIFYNGYNLEPGLIKLMKASGGKAKQVAISEVIPPLQKQGETVPDPHVWGSAANGVQMVQAIRDHLSEQFPERQAEFTANADRLIAELAALDRWIAQQIQSIPPEKRKLVTTHDAFQYYATAYGLTIIGTLIGISTEEQPSVQTLKNLVETIRQSDIGTIFAETTINPQLITTVAQEAGVKLSADKLYSDSIGAISSEGDSYSKMLQANTKAITQGLGGNYQPFQFPSSNSP
jgi:manganese/iron transport system substrate-binding protein